MIIAEQSYQKQKYYLVVVGAITISYQTYICQTTRTNCNLVAELMSTINGNIGIPRRVKVTELVS